MPFHVLPLQLMRLESLLALNLVREPVKASRCAARLQHSSCSNGGRLNSLRSNSSRPDPILTGCFGALSQCALNLYGLPAATEDIRMSLRTERQRSAAIPLHRRAVSMMSLRAPRKRCVAISENPIAAV